MLVAVICFAVFSACQSVTSAMRYIWPLPPDNPQVEFVGIIQTPADLQENSWFQSNIAGEQHPIFKSPYSIVFGNNGIMYVSDPQYSTIWAIKPDGSLDSVKPSDGSIVRIPLGLAIDSTNYDTLYVADAATHTVLAINISKGTVRKIGSPLQFPSFLAFDSVRKRLYVSDGRGHHIVSFTSEGKYLATIGTPGGASGELSTPQGIALDTEGNLYVAEMLSSRISVFDSEGHFKRSIELKGKNGSIFMMPKSLTVDSQGDLWISDMRNANVACLSPDGKLRFVLGAGIMTQHVLGFSAPVGVTSTPNGKIYIADSLQRRLSVWQKLTPDYLKLRPLNEIDVQRLNVLNNIPVNVRR